MDVTISSKKQMKQSERKEQKRRENRQQALDNFGRMCTYRKMCEEMSGRWASAKKAVESFVTKEEMNQLLIASGHVHADSFSRDEVDALLTSLKKKYGTD